MALQIFGGGSAAGGGGGGGGLSLDTDGVPYFTVSGGDTTAPTVPGTPVATGGDTTASVTFTGSTDAVGVTGYRVYKSTDSYAAVVATGTSSPIAVTGLANGAAVTFKVSAYDAAGNESAKSAASNSVTPAAPGAPLPASTIMHLSAGSITPVADGTDVLTWADSSGAGNTATKFGTAPKYYNSVVNGKPVVRWVAGDSRYTSAASASDAAQTIMAVVSLADLASDHALIGGTANGAIGVHISSGGGNIVCIAQGVTTVLGAASAMSAGSFAVVTVAAASGAAKIYKNGTLLNSGATTYTPTAGLTTTVGAEGSGAIFKGDMAELIRANAVMSDSERIALHTYFGTKYGITMGGV